MLCPGLNEWRVIRNWRVSYLVNSPFIARRTECIHIHTHVFSSFRDMVKLIFLSYCVTLTVISSRFTSVRIAETNSDANNKNWKPLHFSCTKAQPGFTLPSPMLLRHCQFRCLLNNNIVFKFYPVSVPSAFPGSEVCHEQKLRVGSLTRQTVRRVTAKRVPLGRQADH